MPQKNSNALSVTLYDMSGAPLHPDVVHLLLPLVDTLAQRFKLTVNVVKD